MVWLVSKTNVDSERDLHLKYFVSWSIISDLLSHWGWGSIYKDKNSSLFVSYYVPFCSSVPTITKFS